MGGDTCPIRARENEFVTTFADKARAGERRRGGVTGGLGYTAALNPSGNAPCPSAPCETEPSRKRGFPRKVYNGVTVEFPFETPIWPQDQVIQALRRGEGD